jgi:hypothetical protein
MRKIGELLRDIFGVDGKQTVSFAGFSLKF